MNKIKDVSKKILMFPLRMILRGMFKLGYALKGLTLGKAVNGISALGEGVIRFIYNVGFMVETAVWGSLKAIWKFLSKTAPVFIYKTGEIVILCVKVASRFIKNIVMYIPKSFAKDFSYWASGISAVAIIGLLLSTRFYALALKVTVNGETIGYVESEEKFNSVISQVEDDLGTSIGENYVMASRPQYAFSIISKNKMKDTEVYSNAYSVICEEIGTHYGLYVDNELVAAADTEGEITRVLDELKAPYVTGAKNETVEFVANVKVRKGIYAPSYFISEDELRAKFSASTNPKYYVIQEDDYLSTISKNTGISRSKLYALNPGLDERMLVPGKKLNISQPDIYLGIKIVKSVTYSESIAYETVKIKDSSLYKTQTKVKTSGKKGEKEVTAQVTYIDGAQVSKKITSEKVVSKPVTREIYVGTKELPTSTSPLAGTGTFIRPINGGYTSCKYGGYRGHSGVDLTMSGAYGKPVYASAAGTVIYAGWSGGYGKKIMIRHSNGYVTTYAHLSSMLVSSGQSVYQGQQIGRIGSTGNSTGPHLHFEISVNGSTVNPLRYIG